MRSTRDWGHFFLCAELHVVEYSHVVFSSLYHDRLQFCAFADILARIFHFPNTKHCNSQSRSQFSCPFTRLTSTFLHTNTLTIDIMNTRPGCFLLPFFSSPTDWTPPNLFKKFRKRQQRHLRRWRRRWQQRNSGLHICWWIRGLKKR